MSQFMWLESPMPAPSFPMSLPQLQETQCVYGCQAPLDSNLCGDSCCSRSNCAKTVTNKWAQATKWQSFRQHEKTSTLSSINREKTWKNLVRWLVKLWTSECHRNWASDLNGQFWCAKYPVPWVFGRACGLKLSTMTSVSTIVVKNS